MKRKNLQDESNKTPLKAVIFGDNVFSRSVCGRILYELNQTQSFNCTMVRDNPAGENERINKNYRIILKGAKGETECDINFVNDVIDGYADFDSLSSLADNKDISTVMWAPKENTWLLNNGKIKNEMHNPLAQLTMLLFRRFCLEMHGFTIIPMTDEDCNGDLLKKYVIEYSNVRELGMDFINWLNFENIFVNTVVQNIPQGENMTDRGFAVYAEKYLLFVMDRSDGFISESKNVVVQREIGEYYMLRKHIYNGAIASSCGYAMLHDIETVSSFMAKQKIAKHMTVSIFEEIVPTLHCNFEAVQVYSMDMLNRFSNNSCVVFWKDLAYNLAETFAKSIVPIIIEYVRINERNPKHLVFSLFCTIEFYRYFSPEDEYSKYFDDKTTEAILKDVRIWGEDLSFLLPEISAYEEKM